MLTTMVIRFPALSYEGIPSGALDALQEYRDRIALAWPGPSLDNAKLDIDAEVTRVYPSDDNAPVINVTIRGTLSTVD